MGAPVTSSPWLVEAVLGVRTVRRGWHQGARPWEPRALVTAIEPWQPCYCASPRNVDSGVGLPPAPTAGIAIDRGLALVPPLGTMSCG